MVKGSSVKNVIGLKVTPKIQISIKDINFYEMVAKRSVNPRNLDGNLMKRSEKRMLT